MKLGLSPRELRVVLLGGLIALLALWVYSAYIVGPMWREVVNRGTAVRDAQAQLAMLKQETANEEALEQQHRQLDEIVVALRQRLPSEAELPSIIEYLSDLARQTQVKIQTIFPQRPMGGLDEPTDPTKGKALPAVYKEIPIQIDAQAPYHQLGSFLSLVESGVKPMSLSSLRISGSQKEPRWHNINMVILGYFAMTDEELSSTAGGRP